MNSFWSAKNFYKIILLLILVSLLLPNTAFLATPKETGYGLNVTVNTGAVTDLPKTELPERIGQTINYLIGIVGTIFLVVIIIGGFIWMTAGGNEDKVAKAKKLIVSGILGIIIIFLAYAITYFVINALTGTPKELAG